MPQAASTLEREAFLRILLMGSSKIGKAQPIDEPVLTPSGWRKIGDLQVGDEIIGSNGLGTRVIGVFPQGRKKVVRVKTRDGAWARCCEDHLWMTTDIWGISSIKTARAIRALLGTHYLPTLEGRCQQITEIIDDGQEECVCIQIDAPDSLYVTRDFLLTHNTTSTVVSLCNGVGPGYVIVCGDKSSLTPAARRTKKFAFDIVRDETDMEACMKEGRRGVKEGEYKWVFVDDFSLYASWLEGALRDKSAENSQKKEPDGRRYWPEFKQRLLNIPRRLFDLKAHVVFASHYIESGPEIDGQRAKTGRGIMPMIGGSAREELPALFPDVLFMEKISEKGKEDRRVFQVNPEGVWGPGSRSVDGTQTIDADFAAFLKLANADRIGKGK
jgi:hypothetical protein